MVSFIFKSHAQFIGILLTNSIEKNKEKYMNNVLSIKICNNQKL